MHGFCEDMRQWISAHPQNVTAVHCKVHHTFSFSPPPPPRHCTPLPPLPPPPSQPNRFSFDVGAHVLTRIVTFGVGGLRVQAGKGRTGTVIAAYLMYCGQRSGRRRARVSWQGPHQEQQGRHHSQPNALRALLRGNNILFVSPPPSPSLPRPSSSSCLLSLTCVSCSFIRLFPGLHPAGVWAVCVSCVCVPSYMKIKKAGGVAPGPTTLFLHAIVIHHIPKAVKSGGEVFFLIKQGEKKWKSAEKGMMIMDKDSDTIVFDVQSKMVALNEVHSLNPSSLLSFVLLFSSSPLLTIWFVWWGVGLVQDCKFEFYHKTSLGTAKLFHVWMNTRFQKLDRAPNRAPVARAPLYDDDDDDEDGEEMDEDDKAAAVAAGLAPGTPAAAKKAAIAMPGTPKTPGAAGAAVRARAVARRARARARRQARLRRPSLHRCPSTPPRPARPSSARHRSPLAPLARRRRSGHAQQQQRCRCRGCGCGCGGCGGGGGDAARRQHDQGRSGGRGRSRPAPARTARASTRRSRSTSPPRPRPTANSTRSGRRSSRTSRTRRRKSSRSGPRVPLPLPCSPVSLSPLFLMLLGFSHRMVLCVRACVRVRA